MVHDLFEHDAYETMAEVLDGCDIGAVLDVGAYVGSACDRLLEVFPESVIYAFEPVRESFERLSGRMAGEPRVTPVNLAVGDRDGEVEILINGQPDTSSALPPTEACVRYHGEKVRAAHRECATMVTLDRWAQRNPGVPISALKIDVQGLELSVLKGARGLLASSVLAVLSEAQLSPIYEGGASFAEIDLFLREQGFVLHQVCRIASGGPEQRTTCCDALWVRADVHERYVERVSGAAPVTAGATA